VQKAVAASPTVQCTGWLRHCSWFCWPRHTQARTTAHRQFSCCSCSCSCKLFVDCITSHNACMSLGVTHQGRVLYMCSTHAQHSMLAACHKQDMDSCKIT
jgi:hypothetical protein